MNDDKPTPTAPAACDCCKRVVPRVRSSAWHGQSRICIACFYVWYDGPVDGTDPEAVAAYVLQAETAGTFPFGGSDADYRRVA